MKAYLLFISLFFAATAGFSNKIDSLQTPEEVQHFITMLGARFTGTATAFLKTDIDGNGLTDLIVKAEPLMVVMDKDTAGYQLYHLRPSNYGSKYTLESIDSAGSRKLLLVKTATQERYLAYRKPGKRAVDTSLHKLQPVDYFAYRETHRVDTLVYRFGQFIEYNAVPPQYKIRSVRLAAGSCLGSCPVYDLTVNNDRTATYNAGWYTKKAGHFTGIIDEHSFNELMQLLYYIPLRAVHDNYSINVTDHPTGSLTIVFEDGDVKNIRDYGMMGTQGLRVLYGLIDHLRTSQQWKAR